MIKFHIISIFLKLPLKLGNSWTHQLQLARRCLLHFFHPFIFLWDAQSKVSAGSDSPGCGRVVGQECGALALPSEAVSGLVVARDHGLGLSVGFALLRHGPVPLTTSLLQPASAQAPFLQVDPTELVVYGWVVEKVQGQQHHDKEPIDPHADQSGVITEGEANQEY